MREANDGGVRDLNAKGGNWDNLKKSKALREIETLMAKKAENE